MLTVRAHWATSLGHGGTGESGRNAKSTWPARELRVGTSQQPVSHIHAIVNDSANKTGVLTLLRRRRYIYVLTETWKIIRARSELGFRVLE